MRYMGSKRRIAKDILPIILRDRRPDQYYVEPFLGGANTMIRVDGPRIGGDSNRYLIALYQGCQDGRSLVFDRSKAHYNTVREQYRGQVDHGYDDYHVGLVGFMASANGRFFEGGYSGSSVTKKGGVRDYIDEAVRGLSKDVPLIQGVDLHNCSYDELELPENSIVYCDPPYKDTKPYGGESLDYTKFWDWCRAVADQGHKVFISEYSAPEDFIEVWSQGMNSSIGTNAKNSTTSSSTERLFTPPNPSRGR